MCVYLSVCERGLIWIRHRSPAEIQYSFFSRRQTRSKSGPREPALFECRFLRVLEVHRCDGVLLSMSEGNEDIGVHSRGQRTKESVSLDVISVFVS